MSKPTLPIRILSYNIRWAAPPAKLLQNEKPWELRGPLVLEHLLQQTGSEGVVKDGLGEVKVEGTMAAFICLQECLHEQLEDILAGLNAPRRDAESALRAQDPEEPKSNTDPLLGPGREMEWSHIGVGRDDGMRKGEYIPIIYPTHIFKLLSSETVWLSPTPGVPSLGWDAVKPRVLTLGVFEHRVLGRRVVVANTHLDHEGREARVKSVSVILEAVERAKRTWVEEEGEMGVVVAGDWNEGDGGEACREMERGGMRDLYHVVGEDRREGGEATFTGFRGESGERIDYIWVGPGEGVCGAEGKGGGRGEEEEKGKKCVWRVERYKVLDNVAEDGVYKSDHKCLVEDLVLL
ncbi:hypothetical protein K432DRAFT_386043 [Lepidopterella palustris CBS 459.81]|uniref:Endonuclease/exonuclease/phosphatase domain-containing protein n=1 Tax=Lepidopterella palustris CBS 459.81 TaxID=1314670 RepID=A0A8E2E1H1_9PEZI|nr:hypothetical protein K432DRAFT_386043 [Lepidopterella palustris CBS 459.81]